MFSQQASGTTKIQSIIRNIQVHFPFLVHFQQKYHTDYDPVLFNGSGVLSPVATVSGCSLQDGDYVFVLFIPPVFRKVFKYSDVSFEVGKHTLNSMLLENNPRFLHSLRIRCTFRGFSSLLDNLQNSSIIASLLSLFAKECGGSFHSIGVTGRGRRAVRRRRNEPPGSDSERSLR